MREHVGVVVLAGHARRVEVVAERGAHAATLLAAICSPWPEPPSTMPRSASPRTTARPTAAQNCGVVDRIRAVGAEVEHGVVEVGEHRDQVALQVVAGVVGADGDPHGDSLRW
jgi:hypothetical protein